MRDMGTKIAQRRKELGITQIELAEKMHVTRQTVSRWESGAVYPDIEKVADLASILELSCDALLGKDDTPAPSTRVQTPSRLLQSLEGRTVRFTFYDDEEDMDLMAKACKVESLDGNWMTVTVSTKKGPLQKLVAVSSILSVEILGGNEEGSL